MKDIKKINSNYSQEIHVIKGQSFDRIQGKKLNKKVHRSIGAFTCKNYYSQTSTGSGILLSRDLVLTAAHIVFNKIYEQVNTDFKFYIGADGVANDYHQIQGWRYLPQYQSSNNDCKLKYDYALVKLKKDKGLPITFSIYPQLTIPCQKCFKENIKFVKLQIYGFPSVSTGNFELLEKGMRLYQYGNAKRERITVFSPQNNLIGYKINTESGQSGCPLIVDEQIIGIHNGGAPQAQINKGRLITPQMVANLIKWGSQLGGQAFIVNNKQNHCEPVWRLIKEGLNLQGKCCNNQCIAYKKDVWSSKGFGYFNMSKEILYCRCPVCKQILPNITNMCLSKSKMLLSGKRIGVKSQQSQWVSKIQGHISLKAILQASWNYLQLTVSALS